MPREVTAPIKTKFQIVGKEEVNHNCYIFKFKFDGAAFPLKMSQHFRISEFFPTHKAPQGEEVAKYYTPITTYKEFESGVTFFLFTENSHAYQSVQATAA